MIYKSSYFNKELRQVYFENKVSTKRKIAFALFVGLLSFAIYFAAQPLKESVLYDTIPVIMQPGYFSTLFIYIHVALAANTLYFMIYYESLFFHEISKNSWYLLVKMGYNAAAMIFSKMAAVLLSTAFIYTLGFVFTIFLTFFLKYNLLWSYFPTLYLAGLIDLLIISAVAMMISPFVKTVTNARYLIFFSPALLMALKIKLNYYEILSNRVTMQSLFNLFDTSRSSFLPVAVIVVALSTILFIIKARNISRYYNLPYSGYVDLLPSHPPVVLISKTGRHKPLDNRDKIERRSKIFDLAFTSFLIIFVLAALAINVMILLISVSTPGKEVSIGGVIPYIFQSRTMEPAIMLNDLAYFKEVKGEEQIGTGDIILFEENHTTYVERIVSASEDSYQVDIDCYPDDARPGSMIKDVKRKDVRAIFSSRNRWLGALILFANTIFGRLLFLLIPAILLFYHRPLTELLLKRTLPGRGAG